MFKLGIAGVFGPEGDSAYHVQSICDQMDVPHIETSWDIGQLRQDHRVNLTPYPYPLAKVTARKDKTNYTNPLINEGLIYEYAVLVSGQKMLRPSLNIREQIWLVRFNECIFI